VIYIVCDECGHLTEKMDGYAKDNYRCPICKNPNGWLYSDHAKASRLSREKTVMHKHHIAHAPRLRGGVVEAED
jgi:phage FluMu protein Com